jgi:hypothetical protein
MSAPALEMSVVLPADSYATIRDTLAALRAQSVRHRLELVIVAQSADGLGSPNGATDGFGAVKVAQIADLYPLPQARAHGVLAASAPVVLFAESHCYPAPRHCEALLDAHRGPWAAVGPAIGNANPDTMRSWAALYMDYGPWVDAARAGEVDNLPGHNSSYKRSVLVDYGDCLEAMMESSLARQADLRSRGHRLYLEPGARTHHLNVTRSLLWIEERYVGGRAFAAARSGPWSRMRRVLYAAGSPLIPAVRMRRILGDVRRSGNGRLLPRLLPALALGLAIGAVGEGVGYARGAGGALRRLNEMELHKVRCVRQADRPDVRTWA